MPCPRATSWETAFVRTEIPQTPETHELRLTIGGRSTARVAARRFLRFEEPQHEPVQYRNDRSRARTPIDARLVQPPARRGENPKPQLDKVRSKLGDLPISKLKRSGGAATSDDKKTRTGGVVDPLFLVANGIHARTASRNRASKTTWRMSD